MNTSADPEKCPYVGLEPFENSHRSYFFGRGRDIKIISDHIIARPITILYGPSGVGKTSILNVGLSNELAVLANWTIVRLRDWQDPGQLERHAVDALLAELKVKPFRSPERLRFVPLVNWMITRRIGLPILLILDQFEEYFLYRDPDRMRDIEQALGGLISRRDVPLHVLVTLRDDAMHRLDQLRGAVPGILDTTVKLEHLRDGDVDDAIRSPIARYNADFRKDHPAVIIGDNLPATLIQQLKEAETGLGKGHAYTNVERRIELPYLQLALTKLWEASGGPDATTLSESTLVDPAKLGGVRRIVRDHVRLVMDGLTVGEQELCAKIFDRLVTGIGSKVAYPTEGLAADDVVGPETTQDDVKAVLDKLTTRQARILKPVMTNDLPGFEIFHDVLALPVLEWKREFQLRARRKEQERINEERRRKGSRSFLTTLALGAFIFAVVLAYLKGRLGRLTELPVVQFSVPDKQEGLTQYFGGVAGAAATELATALKRSVELGGGVPPFYRSPFFLTIQISIVLFAGILPVAFDASSVVTAFYLGISFPLVFDYLARGIQSPARYSYEDDDGDEKQVQ
jgi:hypothetical protein